MVANTIESTGSGLALVAAEAMQRGDRSAVDLIDGTLGWQSLFTSVIDLATHVIGAVPQRERAAAMLRSTRSYMDSTVRSRADLTGVSADDAAFYAALFLDTTVIALAQQGFCRGAFEADTAEDGRTVTVALSVVALHLLAFEASVRAEQGDDLEVAQLIETHRARTLAQAAAA